MAMRTMYKLVTILSFLSAMLTACGSPITENTSTSKGLVLPFARSDIIPGQTTASEVKRIMGDPASRSSFGSWSYNTPNQTQVMTFIFEKEVVTEIWTPISDFSLGDLIDQLGAPEIVELSINQPDVGPPLYPQKVFHYPSLGVSYYTPCIVDSVNLGEDCQLHYPTDKIERMSQYVPLPRLEFQQEIAPGSVVIDWQGFQE